MSFNFYPLYQSKVWLLILIYIAFALLLYFLITIPMRKYEKRSQEVLATLEIYSYATVFSKALKIVRDGSGSCSIPYISFERQDGTRIDFEIEMSHYVNLKEGDFGYLTYKENNGLRIFISFKLEN